MFIGRQKELDTLNKQYAKNAFAFIPIYGRRRVGKTQLIDLKFLKTNMMLKHTTGEWHEKPFRSMPYAVAGTNHP